MGFFCQLRAENPVLTERARVRFVLIAYFRGALVYFLFFVVSFAVRQKYKKFSWGKRYFRRLAIPLKLDKRSLDMYYYT